MDSVQAHNRLVIEILQPCKRFNWFSMTRPFPVITGLIGVFFLVFAFSGCMNSESNSDAEQLIRVKDRVLTVLEFKQVFEITKTAYNHNFRYESDDYRNAQLRLLNDLMIEMIILERAAELGLAASDEEVDKAVADIKKDYPGDTFEKTLLEYAVSYETWRERLRNQLLMRKVIDHELKDQILITPEDIAKFYEESFRAQTPPADAEMQTEDINEMIIEQLRQEKMEQAYRIWIKKLKQQYPIEINSTQWERISGSHLNAQEVLDSLNSTGE